jgi:hypothetical protein
MFNIKPKVEIKFRWNYWRVCIDGAWTTCLSKTREGAEGFAKWYLDTQC